MLFAIDVQIELIGLFMNSNKKQHGLLILPLNPKQIRNKLPIAINIHTKVIIQIISKIINLTTGILIAEPIHIRDNILELGLVGGQEGHSQRLVHF